MADTTLIGQVVRVFISGRHDFTRWAKVLDIRHDDLFVRWIDFDLPNEWIPARWL
jgi:hypothetical protein